MISTMNAVTLWNLEAADTKKKYIYIYIYTRAPSLSLGNFLENVLPVHCKNLQIQTACNNEKQKKVSIFVTVPPSSWVKFQITKSKETADNIFYLIHLMKTITNWQSSRSSN